MSLASGRLLRGYPVQSNLTALATPSSGNSMDDEFDDGVLDSSWTQVTVGGSFTATEGNGLLSVNLPGVSDASGDFSGMVKAWTPTAGDTFETRFSWVRDEVGNGYLWAGLVFAEGTTDSAKTCIYGLDQRKTYGGPAVHRRLGSWTAPGSQDFVNVLQDSVDFFQVRFTYAGTNSLTGAFSGDGVTWVTLFSGTSVTITPTHVGLWWTNYIDTSSVVVSNVTFDYFRKIA
jgi:hypothetical protein